MSAPTCQSRSQYGNCGLPSKHGDYHAVPVGDGIWFVYNPSPRARPFVQFVARNAARAERERIADELAEKAESDRLHAASIAAYRAWTVGTTASTSATSKSRTSDTPV